MPARRAFFREATSVPTLIQTASDHAGQPILVYALSGGWPTSNSSVRLLASLAAVLCAFTFAFIAALAAGSVARKVFAAALAVVALLAAVVTCMDVAAIIRTASECAREECQTLVPDHVLESGHVCRCSVDPWFYFTAAVDLVLLAAAGVCLALTVVPMWKRRGVDPSRTTSS